MLRSTLQLVFLFGCVLLLHGLSSDEVHAQTPAADTLEAELPEVVVQATRTTVPYDQQPFSFAVYQASPQEVALAPRLNLSDALGQIPGMQVDNRGHFALDERISVRGIGLRAPFGTRGVNVVLDGIQMTMPDGQAVLEAVEPSLIQRAELLRGPSSLFWGNASGGALLLSTERPVSEAGVKARIAGGSFGNRQVRGEAFAPIGNATVQGYGSHITQDGYREYSSGYRSRAGLHSRIPLTGTSDLRISGAFVDQETDHPGTLNLEQIQEDPNQARPDFEANLAGKRSMQGQLGLSYTNDMNAGRLTATGFGIVRSLENPLPFAFIDLQRTAGGLRLGFEQTSGPVNWNVGLDASGQWDGRKNFNTVDGQAGEELSLDQFETVLDAGAFGTARIPLTDRIALQGGLRFDAINFDADDRLPREGDDQSGSRSFFAISPAAGISYAFDQSQAYLNYRTAFEAPTTTELVNRPDLQGGFNPDIEPQRIQGLEAGWRGWLLPGQIRGDVAAYRLFVDDRLVSYRTEEGGDRDFFRNAGLTTHDGIEVGATAYPTEFLTLNMDYSFSHYIFREDDLSGNAVPGISPHKLFATVTGEWNHLWARARAETASTMYVNDQNESERPGYTRVDLQTGLHDFTLGGASFAPFASIDNVFDEQYIGSVVVNDSFGRFYEPAPGRSFTIGLQLEF